MEDITGFGIEIRLIATETYPVGFSISQFTSDADPFDIPSVQLADKEMGVNGDLIVWSKANPINLTFNVIPNSIDDINLTVLANANRVGQGKSSARDKITIIGVYPDGHVISFLNGKITDASLATSLASSGRLKTKSYTFTFQDKVGV